MIILYISEIQISDKLMREHFHLYIYLQITKSVNCVLLSHRLARMLLFEQCELYINIRHKQSV